MHVAFFIQVLPGNSQLDTVRINVSSGFNYVSVMNKFSMIRNLCKNALTTKNFTTLQLNLPKRHKRGEGAVGKGTI